MIEIQLDNYIIILNVYYFNKKQKRLILSYNQK